MLLPGCYAFSIATPNRFVARSRGSNGFVSLTMSNVRRKRCVYFSKLDDFMDDIDRQLTELRTNATTAEAATEARTINSSNDEEIKFNTKTEEEFNEIVQTESLASYKRLMLGLEEDMEDDIHERVTREIVQASNVASDEEQDDDCACPLRMSPLVTIRSPPRVCCDRLLFVKH